VEDGPNRWTPPVCDSGARDLLVSGCSGEGRRAAAGLLSSGPRNSWAVREKEKKGKEGSRPRGVGGGKVTGPSGQNQRGESFSFLFFASLLF